ncbi:MAG: hypothetical protein IPJ34_39170 [Myxococcales bacterium]|nr:hypothetical protein [Myxococcales bacterium]
MRLVPLAICLLVPTLTAVDADACGLSPPIGPNGLPGVCRGESSTVRVRVGLSVGGTATKIKFGDERADLLQGATVATLDVSPLDALTLSGAFGAALGGRVDFREVRHDLRPGYLGGLGVSYRLLDGRGALPFAHASFTYSIARATTRAPDATEATFTSKDWRVGLSIGKVVFGRVAPYVVGRFFGAGTDWSVGGGKGSDAFRYHVGVGSAFALGDHLDGLLEAAVLGERRLSVGLGWTL